MAGGEKSKRRNSEKRKEKSRDAARIRRSNEAEIMSNLANKLPIASNMLAQLDKASIVRLAICHLKLRAVVNRAEDAVKAKPSAMDVMLDSLYGKAMDGIVVVLDSNGDILFISDAVLPLLGLVQVDVLGQSVYDFVHPCDHEDIREQIDSEKLHADDNCSFSVRFKCGLNNKAGAINVCTKGFAYKVVHCRGKRLTYNHGLLGDKESTTDKDDCDTDDPRMVTVVTGQLSASADTVSVNSRCFVSHHSLDMKFVSCDDSASKLLGYESFELVGNSLYNYHHAVDGELIGKAYKALFSKGEAMTGLYRFLNKSGGFVWMDTTATLITNQRTEKAVSVVCVHNVISEVEQADVVLADMQQQSQAAERPTNEQQAIKIENCRSIESADEDNSTEEICVDEEETNVKDVIETDIAEEEEDDDADGIQFVTEQILKFPGLADILDSTSSQQCLDGNEPSLEQMEENFYKGALAESMLDSVVDDFLDAQDKAFELKAPYIPVDDMMFLTPLEEITNETIDLITADTTCQSPSEVSSTFVSDKAAKLQQKKMNPVLSEEAHHVCAETLILNIGKDETWIKETEEWMLNLKNWSLPPRKRALPCNERVAPLCKQPCLVPTAVQPKLLELPKCVIKPKLVEPPRCVELMKPVAMDLETQPAQSRQARIALSEQVFLVTNYPQAGLEQVNEVTIVPTFDAINTGGREAIDRKQRGSSEQGAADSRQSWMTTCDEDSCDDERSVESNGSDEPEGSTVLKNLLLKGEDPVYGYRLDSTAVAEKRQLPNVYSKQMSSSSGVSSSTTGSSLLHQLLCCPQPRVSAAAASNPGGGAATGPGAAGAATGGAGAAASGGGRDRALSLAQQVASPRVLFADTSGGGAIRKGAEAESRGARGEENAARGGIKWELGGRGGSGVNGTRPTVEEMKQGSDKRQVITINNETLLAAIRLYQQQERAKLQAAATASPQANQQLKQQRVFTA